MVNLPRTESIEGPNNQNGQSDQKPSYHRRYKDNLKQLLETQAVTKRLLQDYFMPLADLFHLGLFSRPEYLTSHLKVKCGNPNNITE